MKRKSSNLVHDDTIHLIVCTFDMLGIIVHFYTREIMYTKDFLLAVCLFIITAQIWMKSLDVDSTKGYVSGGFMSIPCFSAQSTVTFSRIFFYEYIIIFTARTLWLTSFTSILRFSSSIRGHCAFLFYSMMSTLWLISAWEH